MKLGTLAICDLDVKYTNGLMEYVSNKQGIPFKTMAFTDKQPLLDYISEHYIDILLISASVMNGDVESKNIGKIILLSSGDIASDYIEYFSIYKYQSTESIVRHILDCYVQIHKDDGMISITKGKADIIGVYSPIGRIGKTTFALTMGQILADNYSTLYINMEEFAAFDKLFNKNYPGDLSDLMYFFRQNQESLPIKLQAVVDDIHGMNYIPPLLFSMDLRNIESKEWINLIQVIAITGAYQKIIIDLSSMVGNVFQMLEMCDRVYMPVGKDKISEMKISAYEEYLLKTENSDLLDRTIKVKLPVISGEMGEEDYLEQQLWGGMGDYIRKLLREEGG